MNDDRSFCEHPYRSDLEGRLNRSELIISVEVVHIKKHKSAVSRHMDYHAPNTIEATKPEFRHFLLTFYQIDG